MHADSETSGGGAGGGGRTHTDFIPADFKSAASADSATPAYSGECCLIQQK